MKYRASVCVVGWVCILAAAPVFADNAAEVKELLRLNGTVESVEAMVPLISRQFMTSLQQSYANLPSGTAEVVHGVVMQYLTDPVRTVPLIDQLTAIYERAFTPAEIRELIEFYRTPLGKKLSESRAEIDADSAQVGEAWIASAIPGLRDALTNRLRSQGLISQ